MTFSSTTFFSQQPKMDLHRLYQFFQTNIFWFNVCSFVIVASLCLAYMLQVNGSISNGYQMRELEVHIQSLSLSNQQLEVQSQRVQSLDHIVRSVKMLGLVDADRPEYAQVEDPSYALAQ